MQSKSQGYTVHVYHTHAQHATRTLTHALPRKSTCRHEHASMSLRITALAQPSLFACPTAPCSARVSFPVPYKGMATVLVQATILRCE